MAGFQTYGFVFFGPSWNFERTILQSWLDRMILGSAAHGGGPLMFFVVTLDLNSFIPICILRFPPHTGMNS